MKGKENGVKSGKTSYESGMTRADFDFIADLALQTAGLQITPDKFSMVSGRLRRRVREIGIASVSSYCDLLRDSGEHQEHSELISLLTTNVTGFYREIHHFESLRNNIFPFLAKKLTTSPRVRIWSAGCATGEEPYTIAIEVLENCPEAIRRDLKILATDIDMTSLQKAALGEYSAEALQNVPDALVSKYFHPERETQDGYNFSVKQELRELISFKPLNLMDHWPFRGQFDIIFCRNVVIYFSSETQSRLWPRFAKVLKDQGTLFVGHSERIDSKSLSLMKPTGITEYTKVSAQSKER